MKKKSGSTGNSGKPTKTSNHAADQRNANKGTKGVNKTYAKNVGNKGKQLNPNQKGRG